MGVIGGAVVGLLFPGQGSQFVGMGRELAAASPAARDTFEEADEILGTPLSRLCFDGPESDLTATVNAQPAILVHSIAAYRAVGERLGDVSLAAGHSLGEFTAWVAAGALAFDDGVRTVRRRGELMFGGGQQRPGAMAAVLGLDEDVIERVCTDASDEGSVCVAANYNAPGQVVVSGDVAAVERAIAGLRAAGARRAVRLNVSGAFHSPLMVVAEDGLRRQLEGVPFAEPRFPVISNVTAEPVRDGSEAKQLLVQQLTSPVRWTACMRAMLDAGVTRFLEIGPGSVLSGLLRRIEKDAAAVAIGTPAQIEALEVA